MELSVTVCNFSMQLRLYTCKWLHEFSHKKFVTKRFLILQLNRYRMGPDHLPRALQKSTVLNLQLFLASVGYQPESMHTEVEKIQKLLDYSYYTHYVDQVALLLVGVSTISVPRGYGDFFTLCTVLYYNLFYTMEEEGLLDCENEVHLIVSIMYF